MRSLLTKVRAKVDFPVPLEPVITITGGAADEKEEAAPVFSPKISKQDPHDLGMESVGTLWVVEYSCPATVSQNYEFPRSPKQRKPTGKNVSTSSICLLPPGRVHIPPNIGQSLPTFRKPEFDAGFLTRISTSYSPAFFPSLFPLSFFPPHSMTGSDCVNGACTVCTPDDLVRVAPATVMVPFVTWRSYSPSITRV